METKRPCIRVRACKHVSAPDYPETGRRLLPLARGPVTIQVVRDFRGGPGSTGGPEPRLFGLSARLSRDTRRSRTFSSRETGPRPLSRETGLRTRGVRLFGRSQG